MSQFWVLESFDSVDPALAAFALSPDGVIAEERLQAFDQGYRDGWEDAAKAHAEGQASISVELAGNLQALSFTYHDARNAILGEMEDILTGIVTHILPDAMVQSLGQMIVERVREAAESAADVLVEIVVNPENVPRLRLLLEGMIAPPLRVVGEASLGEGQAFIRLGEAEQKIDLEAVLRDLAEAVAEFFVIPDQQEARHVGQVQ
ncbi:MAG: hypothetical protein ACK5JR_10065 [Tropicimonas sp.]|uniref:FliH/SctL family protein n=1 Tax=Tropicimonas sp. TaxID=2067044 RepID=UPI003A84B4E2